MKTSQTKRIIVKTFSHYRYIYYPQRNSTRTMDASPSLSHRSLKMYMVTPIAIIVFSLAALPVLLLGFLFFQYYPMTSLWYYLPLPLFVYIGAVLFFLSELFISGGIVRLFHIYYKPGVHTYVPAESDAFKWIIICVLYTPMRKLLEIFPLGRLKNVYLRLMGMKIGTNTLVGGAIQDPCVTEIGENTTMGDYAVIYGHIHDTKEGTLTVASVNIGKNCVIGAGAIIMPGAMIEDNVTIAAGAVVTRHQVLQQGKIYGGIPADELEKQPSTLP